MRSLASWCFRHRKLVVVLWLLALVVVSGLSRSAGTSYSNSFSLPKTQSTEAIQLLQAASPRVSGDTEQIVFATSGGSRVTDASVEARIGTMLAKVARVPHVTEIASPYGPGGATRVSKDRTVAFASVTFDEQAQNLSTSIATDLVTTAQSARAPGLQVAVSGQLAEQANKPSIGGVGIGVVAAGVVLLLVFGSLFAMALPLVSALLSLGTAIGIIGLLSHVMKMPMFAPELVLLIGLGVGVDYALFIVTRHRQGLLDGLDTESAIAAAVDTSGRAVLFAGIIVCIALLGMFALGVSFLYGLAVSAALGVALTMIAALTLLPALLGFLGPRILSRRKRSVLLGSRSAPQPTRGFWLRWASFIEHRPALPAAAAFVLIVIAVVPFFSLRLGSSDEGNDAVGTTTRQAYDLLARGFGPGFNGPLQLVTIVHGAADEGALDRIAAGVRAQPDVAEVTPPLMLPTKDGAAVALIEVYPASAPQAASTTELIDHLRQQTIPQAVGSSGLTVYVGGTTAIFFDFARVLTSKLPLFIGLVVLLSFLLLAIVFRSLVIPLVSAVMNLFSIGAAFGILVAVFQWGWLSSVFGVNRAGPVESFLPVMLFAILFGLSMDYQVFLVTRIHEEWLRTGDNRVAVRNGVALSGRTITAAALIMILVFGSFILGGQRVIKEFGLGLAGGIFVDAIVIRMAIVPSVMSLLGKANWWFPPWLDAVLPRIGFKQSEPSEAEASETPLGDELDSGGARRPEGDGRDLAKV